MPNGFLLLFVVLRTSSPTPHTGVPARHIKAWAENKSEQQSYTSSVFLHLPVFFFLRRSRQVIERLELSLLLQGGSTMLFATVALYCRYYFGFIINSLITHFSSRWDRLPAPLLQIWFLSDTAILIFFVVNQRCSSLNRVCSCLR